MDSTTKKQLVALILVALIVVLVAWYLLTRQTHYQVATLTEIRYAPTTETPPYLTFTFSQPLDPARVRGATAVLKSFQVSPSSPTPPATAAPFLALLTRGPEAGGKAQGPVPFVPIYATWAPSVLTTNTLPGQVAPFTAPMTITGTGIMWFTAPRKT
jgi:hypothetical protein